mmetsp:Transcript_74579/g.121162  ORF Transcript_74579/g.121162 Transcript_74579/m.121162 type:complete len:232 (+) Transcript_74579:194-889(+)
MPIVRLHAMPQRMPSFWRRGMPRSQIQKSIIMPKTNPMTNPSSMSACVPSDTSSITRSSRRAPSRMVPPSPGGAWFCSSHSSSNSTDSTSDTGRPPCARREWNCVRRMSTSVCENPARNRRSKPRTLSCSSLSPRFMSIATSGAGGSSSEIAACTKSPSFMPYELSVLESSSMRPRRISRMRFSFKSFVSFKWSLSCRTVHEPSPSTSHVLSLSSVLTLIRMLSSLPSSRE